jgi:hypothetical protein
VIGNFWTCKSCGGESVDKAGPEAEGYLLSRNTWRLPPLYSPAQKFQIDQLNRDIEAGQLAMSKPRITLPAPPTSVAVLNTLVTAAASEAARALEERYNTTFQECLGYYAVALDQRTNKPVDLYRNKLYQTVYVSYDCTERTFVDQLSRGTEALIRRVAEAACLVAESRGWDNHTLGRLGPLPGAVGSDGVYATRRSATREYEVCYRAYFTVLPAGRR